MRSAGVALMQKCVTTNTASPRIAARSPDTKTGIRNALIIAPVVVVGEAMQSIFIRSRKFSNYIKQ